MTWCDVDTFLDRYSCRIKFAYMLQKTVVIWRPCLTELTFLADRGKYCFRLSVVPNNHKSFNYCSQNKSHFGEMVRELTMHDQVLSDHFWSLETGRTVGFLSSLSLLLKKSSFLLKIVRQKETRLNRFNLLMVNNALLPW